MLQILNDKNSSVDTFERFLFDYSFESITIAEALIIRTDDLSV